ncbi:Ger(x)C family spore germination protein [Caldalkalibacillus salinus]|uniref:Ger(x)C family spore germination protein n=1 Tax=Caldalkalibacillus salinus TaxID=2803787 RepID=UPI00192284E5|nr:Ger(x)C family spore germination protein [Caldalkalibacillus salinus]
MCLRQKIIPSWISKSCLVFLTIVLLVGCVETTILEEMGIIIAVGYDEHENGRMKTTSVVHQFEPEAEEAMIILKSTAFTSKGNRNVQNLKSSNKLGSGQLRVSVFGREVAEEGLFEEIDTLARDATIGSMVYLMVGDGTAEEILSHQYKQIPNIGSYLYQLVDQNIRNEQIISPTLHEFVHDYFAIGKDPMLPIVQRQGDEVKITELALFCDDKMKGTIKPRESFFVKLVVDQFKAGSIELGVKAAQLEDHGIDKNNLNDDLVNFIIENIHSNRRITLVDPEKPAFDVEIYLKARLQEITMPIELSDPKVFSKVEDLIAAAVTNEMKKVIQTLQKHEADVIGFGEVYRSTVRNGDINRENWHEKFKKAEINVKVDCDLARTGVIQ